MDLKHLLNPLPDPPRPSSAPPSRPKTPPEQLPAPAVASGYIHSKFYLSPRRLDPETASVSTNSSTKRRRTNRGRVDVAGPVRTGGPAAAVAMGRTFSELEVPSDESSHDEDQEAVKRGVAQLSLSGMARGGDGGVMVDEYGHMRPGTRVEALKAGTQGTWYVARIVELASFPESYLDGDEDPGTPQQWYPMVCVHYEGTRSYMRGELIEGFSPLQSAWIPQSSLRLMSAEKDMSHTEWNNYKKLWRHGPRGLEDHWTEYIEFAATQFGRSTSNTGVVWAGENHGCPCRFHKKSSAETKRESVGVGRHPERPDRLQKIMEAWQKNTYLPVHGLVLTVDCFVMCIGYLVERLQEQNWLLPTQGNIFAITLLLHHGIKLPQRQYFDFLLRHHRQREVQPPPHSLRRRQHHLQPDQPSSLTNPLAQMTKNKSPSRILQSKWNTNKISHHYKAPQGNLFKIRSEDHRINGEQVG